MPSQIAFTLHEFRLDEFLTDQDDPYLWVAIAEKHWINFESIDQQIPKLLFAVSKIVKVVDSKPKIMETTEQWSFRKNDLGKIESIRIESGDESDLYPEYFLQVSRPSANQSFAIVCAGGNPAPLVGYIESRIWRRQNEKAWIETDEILTRIFY